MPTTKNFPQSRPAVIPEMVTSQGAVRCRFDLFIVLKPNERSVYPGKKRAWCHRGDKHDQDPGKMLRYLIGLFIKHAHKWKLAELWDNTRPKNDPDRCILKFVDGVIEQNRLADYGTFTGKMIIPNYLKQ